jgi:transcriptional regulator with XRE-family HTH domain
MLFDMQKDKKRVANARKPPSKARPPHSEVIKKLRERMGFSQPEFALLFGVNPMTISRWENGVSPQKLYFSLLVAYDMATQSVGAMADFRKKFDAGSSLAGLVLFLLTAANDVQARKHRDGTVRNPLQRYGQIYI